MFTAVNCIHIVTNVSLYLLFSFFFYVHSTTFFAIYFCFSSSSFVIDNIPSWIIYHPSVLFPQQSIMNVVNVTSINVLDNPCQFSNPFQFEITFECLQELKEDLDWKIIYVGSAESEKYDQELESVLVGPVPVGVNKFVFQAPAPDATKVPENDLLGVTVVLVTCSYNEKEFIRVGYYVNNSYSDPELVNNPPSPPRTELMHREILAQKPRVTRFPINWDNPAAPTANAASPGTDGMVSSMLQAANGTTSSSSTSSTNNNKMDESDVIMDMDEDEDMEEDDEEEEDDEGEVDLMEEEDL